VSDVRQVTPALIAGATAGLRRRKDRELSPGLEGTLFEFGDGRQASTVLLTRVRTSIAFIPALVCRDRAATPGRPAELPTERWEETTLESEAFNRRYRLLTLAGQDPGLLRELFSPSLIAWLEREPPEGFGLELNEGFLAITMPRHLGSDEGDRLAALAAEVARRIEAEIDEEGGVSLDTFDEAAELRDLERAIEEIGADARPDSVQEGLAAAKARAGAKPSTFGRALIWGAVAAGIAAALGAIVHPAAGGLFAIVFVPLALWLGWMVSRAAYRWGTISVSRAGLELWTRGYAASRGLEVEDRWRFHGTHRELPMPGFADHVLAGELPGEPGLSGRLLLLGDAAELRASGQEMAFTSDRLLAATAIFIEAGEDLSPDFARRAELPEEYRLEIQGPRLLIWRPVQGNMLRTSAGTDRFCERATAAARRGLGNAQV
jgi:hypothetical protein